MNNTYAWLFFALLLQSVHAFFSTEPMVPDPFPFMDFGYDADGKQYQISYQAYVLMGLDFISWAIVYGLLAYHVPKFLKLGAWVLFGLQMLDFLDYLLFYNRIWLMIWSFPISMNIMKVVIFGFVVLREWIRTQSDR